MSTAAPTTPRAARSLVVTSDPVLLDDVLRLAATAGVELEVAPDAGAARRSYAGAPLVLVGPDAAQGCAHLRALRRSGVVLLADDGDDRAWPLAVALGAERVLFLPEGEEWVVERLAESAEGSGREGVVLAVVGGRGGAGATTLAVALAVTAQRSGHATLLVDGDPLGGGIDLVLGGESDRGLRWGDLDGAQGRVPPAALAGALPRLSGLSVLSWDRGSVSPVPAPAMAAVLDAGRRGHDVVVVDLPRAVDDAGRLVLEAAACVLLVVPAEVRAAAAAGRVAAGLGLLCRDLRLVVRSPGPAGVDARTLSRVLALPLAGVFRSEPAVALALERGQPPAGRGRGPLAQLSSRLLDDLLPARSRAA